MDHEDFLKGRTTRRTRVVTGLVVASAMVLGSPVPSLAQTASSVQQARRMLTAGKPAEALEVLGEPRTAEGLALKTEAAARARKFDVARAAYTALAKAAGKDEARLLHLLGREYLLEADASPDRLARVQTCDTLVRAGLPAQLPCLPTLRAWARDEAVALPVRMAAAATAVRAGDADAGRLLASLASDTPSSRRLLLSVLGGVPSAVAVPLLAPMLEDPDGGVQFSAASALGEHRTPEARAALQRYLAVTDRRIARGAAEMALAAQGDAAALKRLAADVDTLAGGDLLTAGAILRAAGDPKGAAALVRVAGGDHELLRLDAAAALVDAYPPLSESIFEAGFTNKNPLVRAATLRAFRQTAKSTPTVLLTGLADESPEVRTEAALSLTIRHAAAAAAGAAPRPRSRRP